MISLSFSKSLSDSVCVLSCTPGDDRRRPAHEPFTHSLTHSIYNKHSPHEYHKYHRRVRRLSHQCSPSFRMRMCLCVSRLYIWAECCFVGLVFPPQRSSSGSGVQRGGVCAPNTRKWRHKSWLSKRVRFDHIKKYAHISYLWSDEDVDDVDDLHVPHTPPLMMECLSRCYMFVGCRWNSGLLSSCVLAGWLARMACGFRLNNHTHNII